MTLPVGNKYIPKTTPLHVYQLVMLMLKETFRSLEPGHPWKYDDTDFNATGVIFDTTFNKESEVFGKKPAIIVSRGDLSTQPLVTGDRVGTHTFNGNQAKTGVVHSSTMVKIITSRSELTDALANEVFNVLMTCRTLLPRLTSIHSITGLSMSQVSPYEEGDHLFYCAASMQYVMQYKWTHKIEQHLLNSLDVILTSVPDGTERRFVSEYTTP